MSSLPSSTRTGTDKAIRLTTVTAISFSLTFVGVGVALLAGVLPDRVAAIGERVDLGVLLLFLPLCALAFAITAEVVRTAARGPLRSAAPPRMQPLSGWRPNTER